MADVLSQSQIDALLKSMQSDDDSAAAKKPKQTADAGKKYKKYDFYSPNKYTKDKLKMIQGKIGRAHV